MIKKGFTLIELLIVIAIISILVGVAVPYYNDYIVDSRTSVLKSNLATLRKAINQFRADNQRGPARIKIASGAEQLVNYSEEDLSAYPFGELLYGPLQRINNDKWVRRKNIKYLNSMPELLDPQTGQPIPLKNANLKDGQLYLDIATGSVRYYSSSGDDRYDIENNFAFIDTDGNDSYDSYDIKPFNNKQSNTVNSDYLDYIEIEIKEYKGL